MSIFPFGSCKNGRSWFDDPCCCRERLRSRKVPRGLVRRWAIKFSKRMRTDDVHASTGVHRPRRVSAPGSAHLDAVELFAPQIVVEVLGKEDSGEVGCDDCESDR